MNTTFKKLLLTGTALVAASIFTAPANAQITLSGPAAWGVNGNGVTAGTGANQPVDNSTYLLTISNTAGASDGSAANTFNIGAITGTTGGVTVTSGSANDVTVNIASLIQSGAAPIIIENNDADNANVTTKITGNLSTGGTLAVTNNEADNAATVELFVGGTLNVADTTTIKGGTNADALSILVVANDATFTGAVTLDGDSGANAQLNLAGANNVFTGGLDLKTANKSIVTFNGATAQTVTGNITGPGTINVTNADGVTFNGETGGGTGKIIIENGAAALNSAATFKNTVNIDSITLGTAGTGTNTVTFDTTANDFTVTGTIDGVVNTETNNINVLGGKNLTQASAWGTGDLISNVNITGTDTKLDSNAAITAGKIAIGTGATLDAGAAITGAVENEGTLEITAGGAVTGNITGKGNLTATNSSTITGNVDQGTVTIATGQTLTNSAAIGTDGTFQATSIILSGVDSKLALDASDTKSLTLTGPVTATIPGAGILELGQDSGDAETYNVAGNIGTADNKLASVTIGGDNAAIVTANFSGDIYATDMTAGDNDVVNYLGTKQTIAAALTGTGTLNVGSASTNANVTLANTTAANSLQVHQGSTVNINNDVTLVAGFDHDGTMNIDSSAGNVTIGADTIDIDGTTNIGATTPAAAGNVALNATGALTMDGIFTTAIGKTGATTTLSGASVAIGGTSDTTLNIGNATTITDPVTLGAAGKIVHLNIMPSESFNPSGAGLTAITAAGVVNNAGTLVVGVANNGTYGFDDGDIITVIDSAADAERNGNPEDYATQIANGAVKLQNSALLTLTDNGSNAQDLIVKVTHNNAAAVMESEYTTNAATALMGINDATYGAGWGNPGVTGPGGAIANPTGNNELRIARNNLLAAPTAHAANEIAESLAPTVDGGHIVGALNATNGAFNITNDRLASLRTGTGMNAGNRHGQSRVWLQGFGATADQSRRDGVDGYDADSYGLAIGIDTETLNNNGIFGVALSYGETEVDSKNANRTATDVESYQITLYGDYDLDRATFITGMLAYSWHDVSTTRHDVGGITGLNAHGDFDANQWTARANIGRDFQYETMTVTPSILAHWTHYDGDNYTESGAGNAGLNVRQDSVSMFELGAGINAAWTHRTHNGMEVEPSLHAAYRYDFIGDEVSTTNNFIGGGAAFRADGPDPAQHAFNVGAALSLYDTSGWEFTANYDYDFKSDYDAHSGFIRAGMKF